MSPSLADVFEDDDKAPPPPYFDDPEAAPVEDWSLEIEEPDSVPRRRRRRRYVHAAVFALFFCIFLPLTLRPLDRLVLDISHFVIKHLPHKAKPVDKTYSQDSCIRYADWSIDADADSHPGRHAYQAHASFDLRISSHLLYFISRGSSELIHGSIEILDSGSAGSDVASVDVTALYDSPNEFLLTQTCWLRPEFSQRENKVKNGLGIFGPHGWERPEGAHRLSFDIKVRLPRQRMGPTFLRDFETDLPRFAHHLGDLAEGFYFEHIRLQTEGAPIFVQSFKGPSGEFISLNGEIAGTFAAYTSLELQGRNTSIAANVTLHNTNPHAPSRLWMQTDSGAIASNVTLQAHAPGLPSAFAVGALTTRGAVHLVFPAAPPHARLDVRAHTTHAPLRAVLPAAFEGALRLGAGAQVVRARVEDPAGLARAREVVVRAAEGGVEGEVRWVPAVSTLLGGRGVVELATTGGGALEVVL